MKIYKSCALRTRDNPRGHHLEIRKDNVSNCINSVTKDYLVLVSQKSTNTQSKSIKNNSLTTKTMETSQKLTQKNYQALICLWEGFLARPSALPVKELDSMIREVRSSLKSLGLLGKNSHAFYYLKRQRVIITRQRKYVLYNHLHA